MSKENKYTQLCVWPGVLKGKVTDEKFEADLFEMFGARVKYKCEVLTLPDLDDEGKVDPDTGERPDQFFYVHADDIPGFARPRLNAGIRWWEDVIVYNKHQNEHLYTQEFIDANPPTW